MSENDNFENNDQQDDQQPCCGSSSCSDSGNCASKIKYAAFGFIMLLAVGVAANALIEKNKGTSATCGSNTACGDISSYDSTSAPKETSACCPSQKADASADAMASDSASKETAASCPTQTADTSTCTMGSDSADSTSPSKKDCCGSEACKDKDKAEAAGVK